MESSSKIAQVMEFFIKHHVRLFPVSADERYYTPKSPNTTPPRVQRPLRYFVVFFQTVFVLASIIRTSAHKHTHTRAREHSHNDLS